MNLIRCRYSLFISQGRLGVDPQRPQLYFHDTKNSSGWSETSMFKALNSRTVAIPRWAVEHSSLASLAARCQSCPVDTARWQHHITSRCACLSTRYIIEIFMFVLTYIPNHASPESGPQQHIGGNRDSVSFTRRKAAPLPIGNVTVCAHFLGTLFYHFIYNFLFCGERGDLWWICRFRVWQCRTNFVQSRCRLLPEGLASQLTC